MAWDTAVMSSPRDRLAEAMDARRLELGLTWDQVAALSGVHRETIRTIRRGTGEIRPLTKTGIEKALQWATGGVDAIEDGGDPTPVEPAPEDQRPALSPVPEVPDERLDHLEKVADRVADGLAELRQGLQELREERLRKAH